MNVFKITHMIIPHNNEVKPFYIPLQDQFPNFNYEMFIDIEENDIQTDEYVEFKFSMENSDKDLFEEERTFISRSLKGVYSRIINVVVIVITDHILNVVFRNLDNCLLQLLKPNIHWFS